MKQDAGNDVLGCVDGKRYIDQAAIAGQGAIHGDVTESRIERCGVEKNQTHVPAVLGRDFMRVDIGPGSQEIDRLEHIVHSHSQKRSPHKIGAQAQQIKAAKERGLRFFCARQRGARRESEDVLFGLCCGAA